MRKIEKIESQLADARARLEATEQKLSDVADDNTSRGRQLSSTYRSAKRRTAQKIERLEAELAALAEAPKVAAPVVEYVVVGPQFDSGEWTYPRGCVIEDLSVVPPAFLQGPSPRVATLPKGRANPAIKPYRKATAAPVAPRKELVFISEADPVAAWQRTVAVNTEDGNTTRAKDRLLGTDRGSKMYQLAARVGADRNAREQRLVGRRPLPANL